MGRSFESKTYDYRANKCAKKFKSALKKDERQFFKSERTFYFNWVFIGKSTS